MLNGTAETTSPQSGPGVPNGGTVTGADTASGALTGTFSFVDHFTGNRGGTVLIDRTLTGTGGTITMSIEIQFVSSTGGCVASQTTACVEGNWTITGGSGSYSNLHGNGEYAATLTTGTIAETLTGSAQYDNRPTS
jgi:hypothetical protein